jgi:propanediol dehydratase large subunit
MRLHRLAADADLELPVFLSIGREATDGRLLVLDEIDEGPLRLGKRRAIEAVATEVSMVIGRTGTLVDCGIGLSEEENLDVVERRSGLKDGASSEA